MSPPPQPIGWGDPAPLDQQVLETPGAFTWWYADQLNEAGDGWVLIWSFGLPFLPGYLKAARSGHPERPRPALNLVLFKGGEPWFYALEEHAAATWSGNRFVFGSSQITWRCDSENVAIEADLDLSVPGGGRCQGQVRLAGPRAQVPSGEGVHLWAPMTGPAHGSARLHVGASLFEASGLAYHDRNSGLAPFDRLGIRRWTWGRRVTAQATTIYYVTWPHRGPPLAWLVQVDATGAATFLEAEVETGPLRHTWGMGYAPELRLRAKNLDLKVVTVALVDKGPFYLRGRVRLLDGEGWGEWVEPDRIDLDRHRPLVRMRVHRLGGPNSRWLPLFSGAAHDRWRRWWEGP